MPSLGRRVGLGIGGRGEVSDAIEWARLARDTGLESIWVHDTPYERDAITYGAAIASALATDGVGSFRVALGAVNPYTRHPLVLAMTGSALDEILPERIVMGIGTGMPLRLAQMGIPYSLPDALVRVSQTLDQLRALWAGERLPSATPGMPPIQPMFPPVHRIPLFIAAYRKEFVELAGRKADGYLARPCESIPSLAGILDRLRTSAVASGRDPRDIETAGYLLSLVDKTRREALNRAKREPFVIYMMSILGDVSSRICGIGSRQPGGQTTSMKRPSSSPTNCSMLSCFAAPAKTLPSRPSLFISRRGSTCRSSSRSCKRTGTSATSSRPRDCTRHCRKRFLPAAGVGNRWPRSRHGRACSRPHMLPTAASSRAIARSVDRSASAAGRARHGRSCGPSPTRSPSYLF